MRRQATPGGSKQVQAVPATARVAAATGPAGRPFILLMVLIAVAAPPALAQQPSRGWQAAEPIEREIVISLPDRQLALIENGEVIRLYPVAVGAEETPTPGGEFRIVNRLVRPTYYRPGVVIRPGPANPLGSRWLGLDLKGYGIHGTNEPGSIGLAASAGCIRMRNRDVEELFERVRPGDRVRLVAERTDALAAIFGAPQPAAPAAEAALALVAAAAAPR
jgi:lipoprotein-anchoring transpeptidase ErfK/SrfK